MRSNTIERESLSNVGGKNKTTYGTKFLGVTTQQKISPSINHTSKVQAVPITQVGKNLSLGSKGSNAGSNNGAVSIT
jgi:hypothetical protein